MTACIKIIYLILLYARYNTILFWNMSLDSFIYKQINLYIFSAYMRWITNQELMVIDHCPQLYVMLSNCNLYSMEIKAFSYIQWSTCTVILKLATQVGVKFWRRMVLVKNATRHLQWALPVAVGWLKIRKFFKRAPP